MYPSILYRIDTGEKFPRDCIKDKSFWVTLDKIETGVYAVFGFGTEFYRNILTSVKVEKYDSFDDYFVGNGKRAAHLTVQYSCW